MKDPIISPFLFNFFINDLIIEIEAMDVGAKIGNTNVNIIAYCNDIILISPVADHLRRMLKKCEEYAYYSYYFKTLM